MIIFIKTLKNTYRLDVFPKNSIKDIKEMVNKQHDPPKGKQLFYYVYTELDDNQLISELNIREYSTIYVFSQIKYENVKTLREKNAKKNK